MTAILSALLFAKFFYGYLFAVLIFKSVVCQNDVKNTELQKGYLHSRGGGSYISHYTNNTTKNINKDPLLI